MRFFTCVKLLIGSCDDKYPFSIFDQKTSPIDFDRGRSLWHNGTYDAGEKPHSGLRRKFSSFKKEFAESPLTY